MGLYERILGHPFVYEKVRPMVLGGIDYTNAYGSLRAGDNDVILDVGCGIGEALNYLKHFKTFRGIDIDSYAINFAKKKHANDPRVSFSYEFLTEALIKSLQPTCVVLGGLLHHVEDQTAVDIMSMLHSSSRLARVMTHDPVILPGAYVSNMVARLDRGRFCRSPEGYTSLVAKAGFHVVQSKWYAYNPSGFGIGKYFSMVLERDEARA